ncbi:hypothetical protein B0H13DRAFT_852294 [Mycena leptocephala]|nr:hypothetical protein B0H13DRAFT_852294 [Mycena leptocephala]
MPQLQHSRFDMFFDFGFAVYVFLSPRVCVRAVCTFTFTFFFSFRLFSGFPFVPFCFILFNTSTRPQ